MKKVCAILFGLVVLGVCMVFSALNGMVALDEMCNAKWSQVLNQYQRRADLIPNLVDCIKEYDEQSKSEISLIENIQREDLNRLEQAKEDLDKFTEDLDRYDELSLGRHDFAGHSLGFFFGAYGCGIGCGVDRGRRCGGIMHHDAGCYVYVDRSDGDCPGSGNCREIIQGHFPGHAEVVSRGAAGE